MTTFLPYPDFVKSASVLDTKRLGKQRIEVLALVKALLGYTETQRNHPACIMWENHIQALLLYGLVVCEEWADKRNFKDTVWYKLYEFTEYKREELDKVDMPKWLGDPRVHISHQSRLIQKDSSYESLFPNTPKTLDYFWPGPG